MLLLIGIWCFASAVISFKFIEWLFPNDKYYNLRIIFTFILTLTLIYTAKLLFPNLKAILYNQPLISTNRRYLNS